MANVLLTDGLLRKTLSAARSLGRRGIDAYTAEYTRMTPAAFSKYCAGGLLSPNPVEQPEEYADWLEGALRERRIDVLMPTDDAATRIVLEQRERFAALTRFALPSLESFEQAVDKYRSALLVQEAGVPCPWTLRPQDAGEVERLSATFTYPVVIKPRESSGSRGIRIVASREELLKQYDEIAALYPQPMLQEYIPAGERFDVCLLYNAAGELRASFVQREVRHYPADIGPSTVQESVRMPELIEQAQRIMQKLPWHGLVEIEFMRDPRDGVCKWMEINPRFWNSIELAVGAGVDFPHLLYRVAMEGDVEPCHDYEVGQFCRNLLPGDLLHVLFTKKRKEMDPPMFSRRLRYDILSREDPLAALGFAAACARLLFNAKVWKMMFKR